MTPKQDAKAVIRGINRIERECVENGIRLTAPDPELATYQARYRLKEAA